MVYIDNFNAPYRGMIMCHMIADSKEELLAMANKLGLEPEWIQKPDTHQEHFDVCLANKAKAIKLGAMAISSRSLVRKTLTRKEGSILNTRRI